MTATLTLHPARLASCPAWCIADHSSDRDREHFHVGAVTVGGRQIRVELDAYDGEPGFGPYVVLDGLPFPRSEAPVLGYAILDACRTAALAV